MFQHARHIQISGGTFTTHATIMKDSRRVGLEILEQNVAAGAFHNSDERCDPPKCHPRTREAILKKIMDWVQSLDSERLASFIWMYGPAGSGKTAIAQTIAEMCYRAGLLAASFFFSRNAAGRNDKTRFVTTLAYQLTVSMPEIREQVGMALETDPMLLSRSLEAQFQALITEPLQSIVNEERRCNLQGRPTFVVVDGLDECADAKAQVYILNILAIAVKEHNIPLFFLISSRPEHLIRETFNEELLSISTKHIVLDDNYCPDADIRLFLSDKFTDIKRRHLSGAHLSRHWPSKNDIEQLVRKSSGQFIYASTVMKYLDSPRHRPPDRLDIVFGLSTAEDDTPFAELDAIYHHILSSVPDVEKVKNILSFLILAPLWQYSQTTSLIDMFFFYRSGEAYIALKDLHSIMDIPSPEDQYAGLQVCISHASLSDFLMDRVRSRSFFVDAADAYAKFTLLCTSHLKVPRSLDVLGQEPINKTLRKCCMLACPTLELLEELYALNLSPLLVNGFDTDLLNCEVPSFVRWLANQRHPNYKQTLMQHHLHAFDKWLHSIITNSLPMLSPFLAAITLSGFRPFLDQIHVILGSSSHANWVNSLQNIHLHIRTRKYFPEYYDLISQFLMDPARAGAVFIGQHAYADCAKYIWKFLWDRRFFEDLSIWASKNEWFNITMDRTELTPYHLYGKVALDLIPVILSLSPKASQAPALAAFLRDHPSPVWDGKDGKPLSTEKLKAGEAIAEYLKD